MNNLDKSYTNLLQDILDNGVTKQDRTGTGTLSVFGRQIRHKMSEGFPILTTKEVHFKSVVTELLWFLRGDTNIKWLIENGCNIWNGDCYKNYLKHKETFITLDMKQFINEITNNSKFGKKWGDMGPIYGKQWRNWEFGDEKSFKTGETYSNGEFKYDFRKEYIDQIKNLIEELKTNPDSRRLMVNAWNVGELDKMILPPCHYGFQIYTKKLTYKERYDYWFVNNYETGMERNYNNKPNFDDEYWIPTPARKISLMWNQRSVDTFLGLPFNITSYGLLLEIIAKEVNMIPDELIGNLGDTHLYLNHVEQAKEQIGRELTKDERYDLKQEIPTLSDLCTPDCYTHEEYTEMGIPKRTREPFDLPTLKFKTHLNDFDSILFDNSYGMLLRPIDFILEDYKHHDKISAPLSN